MNETDYKKNVQIFLCDPSMNETFSQSGMALNRYLQIIFPFLLSLVPTNGFRQILFSYLLAYVFSGLLGRNP